MNNPYLILACVIWLSCGFATAFTKNVDTMGLATSMTFFIFVVWVFATKL